MLRVDFDEHAHTYRALLKSSIGFLGTNDTFFDSYKVYCIKNWVANDNRAYDILDYGCGIGKLTGLLGKDYQRSTVYGYDISKKSLYLAKEKYAEMKNIYFINELPKEQKYDLIIVANVFHHINPDERINSFFKIKELLNPDGKIVVFEHNPFNPLTRYIVSTCPFDLDAKLIWLHNFIEMALRCGMEAELKRYILFFPWSPKLFRNIECLLKCVPLGAQYMLSLAKKKKSLM